jgi:hypothetical protein
MNDTKPTPNLELARELLADPRYPRTARYDPGWQVSLDMGCPTLWLLESLLADNFPEGEGYQTYLRWERIIQYEEKIAQDDGGRHITFARLVARKI